MSGSTLDSLLNGELFSEFETQKSIYTTELREKNDQYIYFKINTFWKKRNNNKKFLIALLFKTNI